MSIAAPWSYSKLSLYKKCPAAFKFRYIDKVKTPPNKAMSRGNEIHTKIEDYVQWKCTPDPQTGMPLKKTLTGMDISRETDIFLFELRQAYLTGLRGTPVGQELKHPVAYSDLIEVESKIRVDENWNLIEDGVKDHWAVFIFDIIRFCDREVKMPGGTVIFEADTSHPAVAEIIDIKTGKIYDEHRDQAAAYALVYYRLTGYNPPVLFLYVDQNELREFIFSPEDLEAEEKKIRQMIYDIDNDEQFEPCESYKCRFCEYRKEGLCI